MFYYKISFLKKAVFSEKTGKNPFVEGHDRFDVRESVRDVIFDDNTLYKDLNQIEKIPESLRYLSF